MNNQIFIMKYSNEDANTATMDDLFQKINMTEDITSMLGYHIQDYQRGIPLIKS